MTAAGEANLERLVERYITVFQGRADAIGRTSRFYAYQDGDLMALQWEIQERDPSEAMLHDALVRLYTDWLDEMTPKEREELFAHNRCQEGEWRSHLLEEELESRYVAIDRPFSSGQR